MKHNHLKTMKYFKRLLILLVVFTLCATFSVNTIAQDIEIRSPDDIATFIPDVNFRNAVYNSMKEYGWLKGDVNNPPDSIQKILETYPGPIDGEGSGKPDDQKIKSIEGIHYLKLATTAEVDKYTVNLSGNLIKDLRPLVKGYDPDNPNMYGYRRQIPSSIRFEGGTVDFRLGNNPIELIPIELKKDHDEHVGYIFIEKFRLINTFTSPWEPQKDSLSTPSFYFLRKGRETFEAIIFNGNSQFIDSQGHKEYLPLTKSYIDSTHRNDSNIVLESTDKGPRRDKKADILLSNIDRTEAIQANIATFTLSTTTASPTGREDSDSYPTTFSQWPVFTIFDKAEIFGDYQGRVQLHKVDRETNKDINGVVYDLYHINNGVSEIVQKDLVTAQRMVFIYDEETKTYKEELRDGYTEEITGLAPGRYYFLEQGADIKEKIEVEVPKVHPYIQGGEKTLNYTNNDGTVLKAKAKDNESYINSGVLEEYNGVGKSILKLVIGENENDIFDENKTENLVSEVKISYRSLNLSDKTIEEIYPSLKEAEQAINERIEKDEITGGIRIDVKYKSIPIVVEGKDKEETSEPQQPTVPDIDDNDPQYEEEKKDIPIINHQETVATDDMTNAFQMIILVGISIGLMISIQFKWKKYK